MYMYASSIKIPIGLHQKPDRQPCKSKRRKMYKVVYLTGVNNPVNDSLNVDDMCSVAWGTGPQKWSGVDTNIDILPKDYACYVNFVHRSCDMML